MVHWVIAPRSWCNLEARARGFGLVKENLELDKALYLIVASVCINFGVDNVTGIPIDVGMTMIVRSY